MNAALKQQNWTGEWECREGGRGRGRRRGVVNIPTITNKHLFPITLHNSLLYNMYLKNEAVMGFLHKLLTIQMMREKVAFFPLLEVPTESVKGEICSCKILNQKQKHFHQKYRKQDCSPEISNLISEMKTSFRYSFAHVFGDDKKKKALNVFLLCYLWNAGCVI